METCRNQEIRSHFTAEAAERIRIERLWQDSIDGIRQQQKRQEYDENNYRDFNIIAALWPIIENWTPTCTAQIVTQVEKDRLVAEAREAQVILNEAADVNADRLRIA